MCRCGVIPREVAWVSCGGELSSACVLCGALVVPLGPCVVPDAVVPYAVVPLRCLCGALRCDSLRCSSSEMSHVIPSRVFQTLKSHRWNFAVFSIPMKSEGTQITCEICGARQCAAAHRSAAARQCAALRRAEAHCSVEGTTRRRVDTKRRRGRYVSAPPLSPEGVRVRRGRPWRERHGSR